MIFLSRLRHLVRGEEVSVRHAIAELVEDAAEEPPRPGEPPELDRQERALIANVLRLRGTSADDVMVPRADIMAIPAELSLEEVLARIRTDGHSRLPVYRENLDDVIGMVHIRDVLAWVGRSEGFTLEKVLRRPLLVAPQLPVLDLLAQMRQTRTHLAMVVDEYGGIDGLVTIEDLVETIVGDIADEHDEVPAAMVAERADGSLDCDARLKLEEFEERFGPVLSDAERNADIDTLGGLVFTLAGRVPVRGEVISHPKGIEFLVLEADARHLRRLRVRRAFPAATAVADSGGPNG